MASAREWKGLAPKQLAEAMGLSDEAIYRLERGERKAAPKKAELRLLAESRSNSPRRWACALARHPELVERGLQSPCLVGELLDEEGAA